MSSIRAGLGLGLGLGLGEIIFPSVCHLLEQHYQSWSLNLDLSMSGERNLWHRMLTQGRVWLGAR